MLHDNSFRISNKLGKKGWQELMFLQLPVFAHRNYLALVKKVDILEANLFFNDLDAGASRVMILR